MEKNFNNEIDKKEKKYDKKRRLDFNDGEKTIGWLERMVNVINTHGMAKVIQAFIVIMLTIFSIMLYNAVDNINLVEEFLINKDRQHEIGTEVRIDVSGKVNRTLTKILFESGADRVAVLEMHNGKENATNLPFLFCDMTYEEVSHNTTYVSEGYVDMNMGKFNFPQYIAEHKYFIGNIDEMAAIDRRFALRMDLNDTKYIAMILIRSSVDIGFLLITYTKEPEISKDELLPLMTYYVQEIGTYLDYEEQWVLNRQKLYEKK